VGNSLHAHRTRIPPRLLSRAAAAGALFRGPWRPWNTLPTRCMGAGRWGGVARKFRGLLCGGSRRYSRRNSSTCSPEERLLLLLLMNMTTPTMICRQLRDLTCSGCRALGPCAWLLIGLAREQQSGSSSNPLPHRSRCASLPSHRSTNHRLLPLPHLPLLVSSSHTIRAIDLDVSMSIGWLHATDCHKL